MRPLRIVTRESKLALWQAHWVQSQLEAQGVSVEIIGITTKGDQILDQSLSKIGGKGLFVKELEVALLENRADLAVHSLKDVPMTLPEGLTLGAICERADPRDALITKDKKPLSALAKECIIGTSSFRRQCQIRQLKPHCVLKDLRGNVPTRIQKCLNGEYDGIIVAAAAISRLDLNQQVSDIFSVNTFLPAAGQGALGLECRNNDANTLDLIKALHHLPTFYCTQAERVVIQTLQGDCTTPIAAYATIKNEKLTINALIGNPNGEHVIQAHASGTLTAALDVGKQAAQQLIDRGAHDIIQALR